MEAVSESVECGLVPTVLDRLVQMGHLDQTDRKVRKVPMEPKLHLTSTRIESVTAPVVPEGSRHGTVRMDR